MVRAEGARNVAGANLVWRLALSPKLTLSVDVPSYSLRCNWLCPLHTIAAWGLHMRKGVNLGG